MLILIVTTLLALITIGASTFIMLPVMDDIYNSEATQELNPEGQAAAENLYNVYVMMPMLFVGGLFLAFYMRGSRRQSDEAFA